MAMLSDMLTTLGLNLFTGKSSVSRHLIPMTLGSSWYLHVEHLPCAGIGRNSLCAGPHWNFTIAIPTNVQKPREEDFPILQLRKLKHRKSKYLITKVINV